VANGSRFNVWAMDDRMRLVRRPITDAWAIGQKPVFDVRTQSGRRIRCTDGHRFFTMAGWSKLSEIPLGAAVAAPRSVGDRVYERSTLSAGHRTSGSGGNSAIMVERLDDEILEGLAYSDILWDPIVSIEPAGTELVYDLTVGELHNFVVDDLLTHNSGAIEQEADIVTFLYRDAYYNKETSPEPDVTELIFAKHRNGRVGTVKLRFRPEHTLFQPYGDDTHYPAP
jgi:replicative DNA helicase